MRGDAAVLQETRCQSVSTRGFSNRSQGLTYSVNVQIRWLVTTLGAYYPLPMWKENSGMRYFVLALPIFAQLTRCVTWHKRKLHIDNALWMSRACNREDQAMEHGKIRNLNVGQCCPGLFESQNRRPPFCRIESVP